MFLLRLDKEIYKNVKLDLKNLGKVNKNGPKHVLNTPMKTRELLYPMYCCNEIYIL